MPRTGSSSERLGNAHERLFVGRADDVDVFVGGRQRQLPLMMSGTGGNGRRGGWCGEACGNAVRIEGL